MFSIKKDMVSLEVHKMFYKEVESVLFIRCNGSKCSQKDQGGIVGKSDARHWSTEGFKESARETFVRFD